MEMIKIDAGIITLKELLELVKGVDPAKVIIDIGFDVPDWTWLEITLDKS